MVSRADARSTRRRGRPATWWLMATALAAAGALSACGGGGAPPAPTTPTTVAPKPTPTMTEESTPTPTAEAACQLPPSGGTKLTSAPKVEWHTGGLLAWPSSDELGPSMTDADGVRSCYAHSPAGALLAAVGAASQSAGSDTAAFVAYFVPKGSPNGDKLPSLISSSEFKLDVIGFKVVDYDKKHAAIDIVLGGTMSGEKMAASVTYAMAWTDGDWHADTTKRDNGVTFATFDSPDGYVPFSRPGATE